MVRDLRTVRRSLEDVQELLIEVIREELARVSNQSDDAT